MMITSMDGFNQGKTLFKLLAEGCNWMYPIASRLEVARENTDPILSGIHRGMENWTVECTKFFYSHINIHCNTNYRIPCIS